MNEFLALEELCSEMVDCPHTTPNWLKKGIPVIRNFNLANGFIDSTEQYFVDEQTYIDRTRRIVPSGGDIIFSREAPVGNCAIIPEKFKCCLGQRLVLLRPNKEMCSSEYLLAMLNSYSVKRQIEQIEKTGSTVSNFNIGDLKKLQIPFVDKNRQNVISFFYNTFMTRIDNNRVCKLELEKICYGIFVFWFLQYEYGVLQATTKYSELINKKIPSSWRVQKIGSIIRENLKSSVQVNQAVSKGNYPFFTSGDEIYRFDKSFVEGKNIFFSTGGNAVIQIYNGKAAYSTDTWCINAGKYTYYLYFYINTIKQRINDHFFAGSGLKHLQKDQLKDVYIPIPNDDEIRDFNSVCDKAFSNIAVVFEENIVLTHIRDAIMPLLINGQATIKQEYQK